MKVAVTEALRNLARDHRIFTSDPDEMWPVGRSLAVVADAEVEPYSHLLGGPTIPRRFGAFSYTHSAFDTHLSVGRYTSISWRVSIMGSGHPVDWASLHPFSHNARPLHGIGAYLTDNASSLRMTPFDQGPQAINVGHDVWIGAESMIKRGVTIGDGAIIGARSIVTKDVPPYAIVVGSPARIVRYRFDEQLIEDLRGSEWWRYGPDVLQNLDVRDPVGFLERLREAESKGEIKPMALEPLTGKAIIEASVIGRSAVSSPIAP